MRILSVTFRAAAIGLTLGTMSVVGHKAASDYCAITPDPDPFDVHNIMTDKARKHRDLCDRVKSLERYNLLYFPVS